MRLVLPGADGGVLHAEQPGALRAVPGTAPPAPSAAPGLPVPLDRRYGLFLTPAARPGPSAQPLSLQPFKLQVSTGPM